MDFPEGEEDEEPQKQRDPSKKGSIATRGSNIMAKIVAQNDVTVTSHFKEEEVPPFGVFTDHQAELTKAFIFIFNGFENSIYFFQILNNINIWGLDVFTANEIIKDQRVLTCTTFKIFQERDLLKTFKIAPKTLLNFLMTLEDHYLKVRSKTYLKDNM